MNSFVSDIHQNQTVSFYFHWVRKHNDDNILCKMMIFFWKGRWFLNSISLTIFTNKIIILCAWEKKKNVFSHDSHVFPESFVGFCDRCSWIVGKIYSPLLNSFSHLNHWISEHDTNITHDCVVFVYFNNIFAAANNS